MKKLKERVNYDLERLIDILNSLRITDWYGQNVCCGVDFGLVHTSTCPTRVGISICQRLKRAIRESEGKV